MACVVLAEGPDASPDELNDHLAASVPGWWLRDGYRFVDEILRTSSGKFDKKQVRERFDHVTLGEEAD